MIENLKIELRKEDKPGTGIIMRLTGEDVLKTKAYDPEYAKTFNGRIDFVKFQTGNVSIIIDNKEISLPKEVLIEALEFLTGTKKIDVN